jgi:FixJ family two-component response regulator
MFIFNPNEAARGATVHVIDDDVRFRCISAGVLNAAGFRSICHANAREFLLAESDASPHCVLFDMLMADSSGIDLLALLAQGNLRAPVIFITDSVDVATSVRAMKAGALDYLIKPIDPEKLLASVRRAIALDTERCAEACRVRLVRQRYERLTERERWVMAGVVQGKRNKQLAVEMYRSERTVKAQRAKLMAKLEADSTADLVRISLLLGLPAMHPPVRRTAVAAVSSASCVST